MTIRRAVYRQLHNQGGGSWWPLVIVSLLIAVSVARCKGWM